MSAELARRLPGPLERTAMELEHVRRLALFRRRREHHLRRLVRESDLLLDLVERCRLREFRLVPTSVWAHAVRLVGAIDPGLRDELGIDRRPDHVGDVLFAAQEMLLLRALEQRHGPPAEIVPLFGPGAEAAVALSRG